eukprot:SAG22_NODE_443_length_10453_cov_8.799691_6_plen_91_part_00
MAQTPLRTTLASFSARGSGEVLNSPRALPRDMPAKIGVRYPRAGEGYPRGHPLRTEYFPRGGKSNAPAEGHAPFSSYANDRSPDYYRMLS